MSKLNIYGWLVLCTCVMAIGITGSGCCGGGSSTSSASGDGDGGGGSGKSLTCNDLSSISQCSEHTRKSMKLLGEDFYKGMCEMTSGSWGDTPCPADDIVGRCDDGDGSITIYYSGGGSPYDSSTAKESCEFLDGSFKS